MIGNQLKSSNLFKTVSVPSRSGAVGTCRSRKVCIVKAEKVLIVNTKGGGHAFIGKHILFRVYIRSLDIV